MRIPRVRRRLMSWCLAAAAIVLLAGGSGAQSQGTPPSLEGLFAGLSFRAIGPAAMGGRVDDFAVYEPNPAIFYVAVATGGLWKTTNNGTTWEVLFDGQDDVVSIGDVAIAPTDPDLVWVGTGENNNRQSSSWGKGVYKSTDGGHTWKDMGLSEAKYFGRIVIDPTNYDVVYVAATGSLWGPNPERGVFKTTDGGLTWTKVLYVNDDTGATDLLMDPGNPQVLYAATYQRRRATWGFNGGGPGSGIYKTSDGGKNWVKLTNGLPEGPMGRIGLDVYRRNPKVLYACIEHPKQGGVYRSDDGGRNWRMMSSLAPRPMFFSQIRIDPNDDHRIYQGGVSLHMSDDGGRTWVIDKGAIQNGIWPPANTMNSSLHSDEHAMWINPVNSNHLLVGNDGGVWISYDRGKTWDFVDNMDIAQAYHVGYDMDWPYRVYVGLQDNIGFAGPGATRSYLGIPNGDWFTIAGGDGFVSVADPTDSRIIYAEAQNGAMNRVDRLTNERKSIRPEPARGEPPLRWNWDTPMIISPHTPSTIYMGANKLFKSTDRGHSWAAISPDLTAAVDREALTLMGLVAKDFTIAKHDGVSFYGTLTTIAESPKQAGLYYTGADDGTVQVSRDGGKTWANVSTRVPGVPKETYVSRVEASKFDAGTVYVTFDGHRSNDFNPYVYMSTDHGQTFRSLAGTLPKGQVVRCITEDLKNPRVLYLGTEFGLFVSLDQGARWTRLRNNLPTVPVFEITLHPRENDMILATHGRSIWILDDLTPIQQASEALNKEAQLFDMIPAQQFNPAHDRWWMAGDRKFWGKNPELGAAVSYYLKEPAKDLKIRIEDAAGSVMCELSGSEAPGARGVNRAHWNLHYQPLPPRRDDGAVEPETKPFGARQVQAHSFQRIYRAENDPLAGPFVLPGEYAVTLVVNGREVGTKKVKVVPDPVVQISDADRKAWHDFTFGLHRLQQTGQTAAEAVADLSKQLGLEQQKMKNVSGAPAEVAKAVEQMDKRLAGLRRQLGVTLPGQQAGFGFGPGGGAVPRRLGSLKNQVMGSTSTPTEIQMRARRDLEEDLAKTVEEVNSVIETGMPALWKTLIANSIQPAPLKPIKPVPVPAKRGSEP